MSRAVLIVALSVAGCGAPSASSAGSLTVYAAASLRDAFEELGAAYTLETGVEILLAFDASRTLRSQIEEGTPADVFASADAVNAQALVDQGLTAGPSRTFARNAVVIVVPADNPAEIDRWSTIARPGIRIIAAGDEVPISRYALELINNLAAHPDAPDGFVEAYAANVVSREDNVRTVLAKVEIGEGDAAIVYETDARASPEVETVAVPAEATAVAEYAVVTLAEVSADADEFVTWLLDAEAQAILADNGFRPPS